MRPRHVAASDDGRVSMRASMRPRQRRRGWTMDSCRSRWRPSFNEAAAASPRMRVNGTYRTNYARPCGFNEAAAASPRMSHPRCFNLSDMGTMLQ